MGSARQVVVDLARLAQVFKSMLESPVSKQAELECGGARSPNGGARTRSISLATTAGDGAQPGLPRGSLLVSKHPWMVFLFEMRGATNMGRGCPHAGGGPRLAN